MDLDRRLRLQLNRVGVVGHKTDNKLDNAATIS